jgi:hypothetical protein
LEKLMSWISKAKDYATNLYDRTQFVDRSGDRFPKLIVPKVYAYNGRYEAQLSHDENGCPTLRYVDRETNEAYSKEHLKEKVADLAGCSYEQVHKNPALFNSYIAQGVREVYQVYAEHKELFSVWEQAQKVESQPSLQAQQHSLSSQPGGEQSQPQPSHWTASLQSGWQEDVGHSPQSPKPTFEQEKPEISPSEAKSFGSADPQQRKRDVVGSLPQEAQELSGDVQSREKDVLNHEQEVTNLSKEEMGSKSREIVQEVRQRPRIEEPDFEL